MIKKYLRQAKDSQERKQVENQAPNEAMKVYKGPFNLNCLTNKQPSLVLQEIQHALDLYKVQFKKVSSSLTPRCNPTA